MTDWTNCWTVCAACLSDGSRETQTVNGISIFEKDRMRTNMIAQKVWRIFHTLVSQQERNTEQQCETTSNVRKIKP
jgi:hypothetical protein